MPVGVETARAVPSAITAIAAHAVKPAEAPMNPLEIISRHYEPGPLQSLLIAHSVLVARKARELGEKLIDRGAPVDLDFLTEASLLHDIGIRFCRAEEILCHGEEPYIRHGVIGREILEKEGLPRHALVCERHTGSGITVAEVREKKLPVPERDYLPISIEEKIVCVADKFYSKNPDRLWQEKTPEKILRSLSKWGEDVARRLDRLWEEIGPR